MSNIQQLFQYSTLATAAYIRLEDEPVLRGGRIAFRANEQSRIPIGLAERMFDETRSNGQPVWSISSRTAHDGSSITGYYHGQKGQRHLEISGL